jgi:hypothetical protein
VILLANTKARKRKLEEVEEEKYFILLDIGLN